MLHIKADIDFKIKQLTDEFIDKWEATGKFDKIHSRKDYITPHFLTVVFKSPNFGQPLMFQTYENNHDKFGPALFVGRSGLNFITDKNGIVPRMNNRNLAEEMKPITKDFYKLYQSIMNIIIESGDFAKNRSGEFRWKEWEFTGIKTQPNS